MKIFQINSHFTVGGPPRIMNGLYDTLIENGHQCRIAAAREKMYAPQDSVRIGSQGSVYFHALGSRLLDNEGFSAKRETVRLLNEIEKYSPDIVQLHNLHGYYLNIEILFDYLRKSGKPVFWTLHDCWSITGHCAYFDYAKCSQWKTSECKNCKCKKDYPTSYLLNRAESNYQKKKELFSSIPNLAIVTPSNWLASVISESFLGDKEIITIHNGIDLQKIRYIKDSSSVRNQYGLMGKKIVLGVAQVWSRRKGYDDFLKLSEMLSDDYRVVLVGLTEAQIRQLPPTVTGISRTNSVEELMALYSASEVFVNLTYEDNFPTVNIEALACGTPVITYRTGGSPEAIDQNCGWVVEQGNLDEIVEIIGAIAHKEDYIQAAQRRSFLFDRKIKFTEYIERYHEVLSLEGVNNPLYRTYNRYYLLCNLAPYLHDEEVQAA